jgi:serine/threonine-protein kinase
MVLAQRYRLEAEIGHGGFSQVFRATELRIGREVAIKIMSADSVDAAGEQRFRREAELARQLTHPNTVHLLDFDLGRRPSPFIVYELLSGETLEALIKREGPLGQQRTARIVSQILKSLMEAHALGVVHRDMKPGNIFICTFAGESDFVKVLDFGIAKTSESAPLTAAGMVIGTPRYMPPEQILGQPPQPSMDLYAVGMMLAEMSCGHALVRGTPLEAARVQLSPDPVPLPEMVEQSVFGPLLRRALDKDPAHRFPVGQQMLTVLEQLIPQLPVAALGPAVQMPPEGELPSGQVATLLLAPPSGNHPTELLAPPSGNQPTLVQPLQAPTSRPPPAPPRTVLLPVAVVMSVLAVVVLVVSAALVWRWRTATPDAPSPPAMRTAP